MVSMTDKDDICRSISTEAMNLNIENLKENGRISKSSCCYSKPPLKSQIKNRSLY
jgi:hypothetical protein